MFEGQSPANYEQKCLCVLVLDTSSSMAGDAINQLNTGLQQFHSDTITDFIASQRLEISIVIFNSTVQCIQQPKLVTDFQMPNLATSGTTKLVDGIRLAMDITEQRKKWYKETGQNYFRPMIVLITDGEPDKDQDIDMLSMEISMAMSKKSFMFYSLGVDGYNHQKLAKICSTPPPAPLRGHDFPEFFKWLSNSIGLMINSKEGQILQLPSTDGWAQITM